MAQRRGKRIRRIRNGEGAARKPENGDSDDVFAYIVGYTEGGAAYGITWQEMGVDPDAPDPSLDDLFAGDDPKLRAAHPDPSTTNVIPDAEPDR